MASSSTANRKGQGFTLDFFVALLIFAASIALFFAMQPKDSTYNRLIAQADAVSEMLITPGIPPDWNSTTLIVPGIAERNRINQTKLSSLKALDYATLKSRLAVRDEVHVAIGEPAQAELGQAPMNHKELAAVQRVVIYGSRIMLMRIEVYT